MDVREKAITLVRTSAVTVCMARVRVPFEFPIFGVIAVAHGLILAEGELAGALPGGNGHGGLFKLDQPELEIRPILEQGGSPKESLANPSRKSFGHTAA